MAKDTKKKANPLLDEEEETTETKKAPKKAAKVEETETETTEETDEETSDEEVEEKPKAKAKGKSAEKPLIEREATKVRPRNSIEEELKKGAEDTKALLSKQAKVRIFIPLGIGEKKGAKGSFDSVTINGYRMVFPKGEYITVPQAVADIIEAHYNMSPETTEMGEAYRLDRPRHKDGMSTEEALN